MPPPSGFSTLAFARLVFRDARSDALSAARGDGGVRRRDAAGGGAQRLALAQVYYSSWRALSAAVSFMRLTVPTCLPPVRVRGPQQ